MLLYDTLNISHSAIIFFVKKSLLSKPEVGDLMMTP